MAKSWQAKEGRLGGLMHELSVFRHQYNASAIPAMSRTAAHVQKRLKGTRI